jgi:hypothetical protein
LFVDPPKSRLGHVQALVAFRLSVRKAWIVIRISTLFLKVYELVMSPMRKRNENNRCNQYGCTANRKNPLAESTVGRAGR